MKKYQAHIRFFLAQLIQSYVCILNCQNQFSATGIIIGAAILGLLWAFLQFLIISRIPIKSASGDETSLVNGGNSDETTSRLIEIYEAIYVGAESFLRAEYSVCTIFILVFSAIVFILVGWGSGELLRGFFTALSFLLGAITSMVSGYLGMKVAVFSNVRTTVSAQKPGWTPCFNTAFRAGAVMGFALCGLGILMLYITMLCFRVHFNDSNDWIYLTECLTGYGLGGSTIAMFGRVGGGIYTKVRNKYALFS